MSFFGSLFGQTLDKQVAAAKAEVVVAEKALQSAKNTVTALEKKLAVQAIQSTNVPVVKANAPSASAPAPSAPAAQANAPASAPYAPSQPMQTQPMQPSVGGNRNRKSINRRSRKTSRRSRGDRRTN